MINVLFCTFDSAGAVAGPNTWLRRLLLALRGQGFRCEVVVYTKDDPASCPMVLFLDQEGFPRHLVLTSANTAEEVAESVRVLAEVKPDIFVPNCIVPAMYASRWANEAGIPTVAVLHSDDSFYHAVIERFLLGPTVYRPTAVVCVSEFLADWCERRGVERNRITRIPCGVECDATPSTSHNIPFRLIYLGRYVEEQKRISDVARALCRACGELPEVEAVMYGDGEARATIETIVAEEGHGLPIKVCRAISPDAVRGELLRSHALVLLSDYEGLPIAVMEAMSVGVVPICTVMRSGIGELVHQGQTGLLVSDRGGSFVSAVRALARDPAYWSKLSAAAHAKIRMGYSAESCGERWGELLINLSRRNLLKTAVVLPQKVSLPRPHPDLRYWDKRPVSLHERICTSLKKLTVRALRSLRLYPR